MLNIDAIHNGRMFNNPFRWGLIENALPADAARSLCREFPRDGFQYRKHKQGRFCRRPLFVLPNNQLRNSGDLAAGFREFAAELNSPEYRRAMSELISIDLTEAPIEASFWRYDHAISFVPHLDLRGKIVTQVFYLNEEWPHTWGGSLRILHSNDIEDVAFQISPRSDVSSIILRSENSWHGITPIGAGTLDSRNTLTVHFYHNIPELIAEGVALAEA
ncbi:MAG TPA: 2OG-Fe(II) oxygenase [Bryobacteraceae bacterium]